MSNKLITESLSGKWYTEKRIFDKETDKIFFNSWLLVCSESKIKKPGETLFVEILNQPLIFIRQEDQRLMYVGCFKAVSELLIDSSVWFFLVRCKSANNSAGCLTQVRSM